MRPPAPPPNERPGTKAPKKERALLRAAYEAARDLGADQTPRRLSGALTRRKMRR